MATISHSHTLCVGVAFILLLFPRSNVCMSYFIIFVLLTSLSLLPNAWVQRSVAEMGQSMGVTSTGLPPYTLSHIMKCDVALS